MAIGRVFTAFSRKVVFQDATSGNWVHNTEVRFDEWTITMAGSYAGLPGAGPALWYWTNAKKIYDVTGDESTNPNMFTSNAEEPNTTSLTLNAGPGSSTWNSGSLLRYDYNNLPDGLTERTYQIRQGATVIAELKLVVPGKKQYQIADGTKQNRVFKEITNVNYLNHFPIEQNTISGVGHAWHHEHKFVGITSDKSEIYPTLGHLGNILTSHSASQNDIPDLTFYVKENADQKNTHTDFKFRPDADSSYSASSSASQQIMTGLLTQLHTVQLGNVAYPVIQLNSDTMRQEMINQGQTVTAESQHLSYTGNPVGDVPDTNLSIIIQAEGLDSVTTLDALSYSSNADYATILSKHTSTSYDQNPNLPVNGFAVQTINEDGHVPCLNSSLAINLISLTNESIQGQNDGTIEIQGTGAVGTPTVPPSYDYLWTGPNGFTSTNNILIDLAPGVYIVTVTDNVGCTTTFSYTINSGSVPCNANVNITQQAGDGCAMIDLSPSVSNLPAGVNSYTWEWSFVLTGSIIASGSNTTSQTLAVNSITDPGLYQFEIFYGETCNSKNVSTVLASTSLSSSITGTDVTTNGGNDGTATVTVTGGTSPYTYQWNTGATTASISSLTAGTYNVFITDSDGCTVSSSITISEPPVVIPTPTTSPKVCFDLVTDNFVFTDNSNYIGIGNVLPYKIAITIKLTNTGGGTVIRTGSLSSPDIFIDNDDAALRTYDATTKYGTNNSISALSGGTLYNDIYEITFDYNFSGGTSVEATNTIKLNALNIVSFNTFEITSLMTFDCNDDIVNSLDTTDYTNGTNIPYTLVRTHSLSAPATAGLTNPVLSSSASALNYTGLEDGPWTNSINSDLVWEVPASGIYEEYCILVDITHTNELTVLCYADPCVVTECIEKVRAKLDRAECIRDINDIKKYRHILKRAGHLLALFNLTVTCPKEPINYHILYEIIDLTDCGCDCECDGCD